MADWKAFVSPVAVALLWLVAGQSAIAQKPVGDSVDKVVIQVSDAESAKWNLALNNARNVQQSLGAGKVDIEIVAYGPGIGMLKTDSLVGDRIADALHDGIKVVACQVTMKAQKLTDNDMLPGIGYVPSGAVELIKKQQQGYAYIRP
jgi:intracellular sulfur oxidation DsrE/DsrF family protein